MESPPPCLEMWRPRPKFLAQFLSEVGKTVTSSNSGCQYHELRDHCSNRGKAYAKEKGAKSPPKSSTTFSEPCCAPKPKGPSSNLPQSHKPDMKTMFSLKKPTRTPIWLVPTIGLGLGCPRLPVSPPRTAETRTVACSPLVLKGTLVGTETER